MKMGKAKTEYLLVCLMEECSEVQKAASKAYRFGLGNTNKTRMPFYTNAEDIVREFCDVIGTMELLIDNGLVTLTEENKQKLIEAKKLKIARYIEKRNIK
jgi:hypothetical protein